MENVHVWQPRARLPELRRLRHDAGGDSARRPAVDAEVAAAAERCHMQLEAAYATQITGVAELQHLLPRDRKVVREEG